MLWEPDDKLNHAGTIYERWIAVHPEPHVWVELGKFEGAKGGERADSRTERRGKGARRGREELGEGIATPRNDGVPR
jgi:hypothetical protein